MVSKAARENADMARIYAEAKIAGDAAAKNRGDSMQSGVVWVSIRPARGPFVKWCKANRIGRTNKYEGGYYISSVDACAFAGQNVEAKLDGCSAFAAVLQANGIPATACDRLE